MLLNTKIGKDRTRYVWRLETTFNWDLCFENGDSKVGERFILNLGSFLFDRNLGISESFVALPLTNGERKRTTCASKQTPNHFKTYSTLRLNWSSHLISYIVTYQYSNMLRIGDEEVSSHLEPLQLRRNVASLRAFCRMYHGGTIRRIIQSHLSCSEAHMLATALQLDVFYC